MVIVSGSGVETLFASTVEIFESGNRVKGDIAHGEMSAIDGITFLINNFIRPGEWEREFSGVDLVGVTLK